MANRAVFDEGAEAVCRAICMGFDGVNRLSTSCRATALPIFSYCDQRNYPMVLDQGIATVAASVVTTLGAVTAVLLGWFFFSDKVKDLKAAIDHSDSLLEKHETSMNGKFLQISEKVEQIDTLFKAKLAGLGKIESAVDDLQKVTPDINRTSRQPESVDKLRQDWFAIRDVLENVAAATNDGRTRAKYARIDRRQYQELIDALDKDNRLEALRPDFGKALELWHRYRNGRSVPAPRRCGSHG